MKPLLALVLYSVLNAATPTPIPTPAHKRPALHYDKAANQALHDKFEAKRNVGKTEVLADMKKQLEGLGNSGAGGVDLTYWQFHRNQVMRSFHGKERQTVLDFYGELEKYAPVNGQTTKAPDAAKMKEALEGKLKQVGLDREMAPKKS